MWLRATSSVGKLERKCCHSVTQNRHGQHKRAPLPTTHAMLSFFRTRTANAVRAFRHVRRYGTPLDVTPKAGETPVAPGALRPHLNIPVNPNHGLYAFFRRREKDGKVTHDPFEDDSGLNDIFGECRRFTFYFQIQGRVAV